MNVIWAFIRNRRVLSTDEGLRQEYAVRRREKAQAEKAVRPKVPMQYSVAD